MDLRRVPKNVRNMFRSSVMSGYSHVSTVSLYCGLFIVNGLMYIVNIVIVGIVGITRLQRQSCRCNCYATLDCS